MVGGSSNAGGGEGALCAGVLVPIGEGEEDEHVDVDVGCCSGEFDAGGEVGLLENKDGIGGGGKEKEGAVEN